MRPHGRARVSSKNPQAFAICDRCGFLYNHADLGWQYDWAGASLINKRILVCRPCMDEAQQQLRAIVLPADPTPIINPRVQNYADAETDGLFAPSAYVVDPVTNIPIPTGQTIATQDNVTITSQPVGQNLGLPQGATMPVNGVLLFDVPISVLSITTAGTTTVTVTCPSPHGLVDLDQVAIYGTSNIDIMGYYSITAITATAFTYDVVPFITAGSWLTPTTRVATTSVGLPYNYAQIPIVGVAGHGAASPYQWYNQNREPIYFDNNDGDILEWQFRS